jgi:hypothetical protein
MILDDVISHDTKIIIAVASAGIWIYFRTAQCYNMIPRMHLFPVAFVMAWAYINYYEPLALPIGLMILASFPVVSNFGKAVITRIL